MTDVYDGSEYMKYSDFFDYKYNLSFSLNFDGAPKFKSSGVHVWPIQLYINDLPSDIRCVIIFVCLLVA